MQREYHCMCPISATELLIVGGEDEDENDLKDAVIMDTETFQSRRVIDDTHIDVPHMKDGKMHMVSEGQAVNWIVDGDEAFLVQFTRQGDHCAFNLLEKVDLDALIEEQQQENEHVEPAAQQ